MKKLIHISLVCSIVLLSACSGGTKERTIDNDQEIDLEGEVNLIINENLDSNVVYSITTPNGEKMVGYTDEDNDDRQVQTIAIETPEGEVALVSLNDDGLPKQLKLDLEVVTYSNYTDTTVDILLERSDGTVEEFPASSIVPKEKLTSIFPVAHAAETEDLLHGASIAVNVIGCGAGVTIAYVSGGSLAPLTYLSCAGLAARVATWKAQVGPCKKDLVQCTLELTIKGDAGDVLVKFVEQGLDAVFPKGITLKGKVLNAITGTSVGIVSITATNSSGTTTRGEGDSTGEYEYYFKNGGSYTLNLGAQGFKDTKYPLSLSDTRLYISFPGGGDPFKYSVSNDEHQEIFLELPLDPMAWIIGEVIDAEEGEPLVNVDIELLDEGTVNTVATDFSGADGGFAIEPPLSVFGKDFTLKFSKEGYDPKTVSIFISYEVKDKTDQYIIDGWNEIIKLQPEREGFAGTYTASFNRSSSYSEDDDFIYFSIDETTTGAISFNFTEEGEAICNATMTSIFSGIVGDEAFNGTGSGDTSLCTGTIDKNGAFDLSGIFAGSVTLDEETGTGDGTFTLSGKIIDGEVVGTIYVDEMDPIPFPS